MSMRRLRTLAARIVPHSVLIYLATKDRRRQENFVTKRDCPQFPSSFFDRIYKIYRFLGELEKIVRLIHLKSRSGEIDEGNAGDELLAEFARVNVVAAVELKGKPRLEEPVIGRVKHIPERPAVLGADHL